MTALRRPDDKARLERLLAVAAGRKEAELVIKGGKVFSVITGSLLEKDIAIEGGVIAGIGNYTSPNTVDAEGGILLPGFIESHIHIESSFLRPAQFGRTMLGAGVTTAIADPHEIANAAGIQGLRFMQKDAKNTALDIQYMLPSCVPASPHDLSAHTFTAKVMRKLLKTGNYLGLGEFMDFQGIASGNSAVIDKLLLAKRSALFIDGHAPCAGGAALNAIAALCGTDHECTTQEEAREKLEAGMYIMIREGSACNDLAALLGVITKENERRILFGSDDREVTALLQRGSVNEHLRLALSLGLDALSAVRMVTLNASECYGLHDRGALLPGRRADIVLVDNLRDFTVRKVWVKGVLEAENGRAVNRNHAPLPVLTKGGFHVKNWTIDKLRLPLSTASVSVIDIVPRSITTLRSEVEVARDERGDFKFSDDGIAKIAVIERHRGTGRSAVALIRGYGIKRGAIALSIAHDSHNIVVCGRDDKDMHDAVLRVIRRGGGIVVVSGGQLLAELPLPIAGLMSALDAEETSRLLETVIDAAHSLGVSPDIHPILTLSFMPLPVVPHLKITAGGLFDVDKGEFVRLPVTS